ncbi:hypothetical protein M5689_008169 [Euphorbia peplus]|nr:hypothetical protein M5689_008169 [Euphorbia peplus]
MRGLVSFSPLKHKFKQIYPGARSWGTLSTSTPKKQNNANDSTEGHRILSERAEPVVAFSRPPPQPPVFGPIVAVSLLEMWLSRNDNDE